MGEPRFRGRLAGKVERGRPRWWIGPAVVAALGGGFGVLFWLRSLPPAWIDFKDPNGLFTASFPEQPKASQVEVPTWTGNKALDRTFSYGTAWEDEFYGVEECTYDQPVPADKVEVLFDSIARALETRLQGFDAHDAKLAATRPWTLAGHPGRELEFELHHGGGLIVDRLLLVDRCHMFIVATGVHSHHHGENDARFFASFKLTQK